MLQKNRKMIPCYWENQPGGCRKPHCSFQHKNPREPPTVADMEKAKECMWLFSFVGLYLSCKRLKVLAY